MKKIYNPQTGEIFNYPRLDDNEIVSLDPKLVVVDLIFEDQPEYNPRTQSLETITVFDADKSTVTFTYNIKDEAEIQWAVVYKNYVIDFIRWDGKSELPENLSDKLIIEDTSGFITIGDWYEEAENLFYKPLGTPPDWPDELQPPAEPEPEEDEFFEQ